MSKLKKILFQKNLIVFVFVGLCLIVNCTAGFATTLNPDTDIEVNQSNGVYDDISLYTYSGGSPSVIYLKFDLSSLKGQGTVTSATLQLASTLNLSNVSVYYVADDNWDIYSHNEKDISWDNSPALSSDPIAAQMQDLSGGEQLVTWNLKGFNFTNDIAEGYLTLALKDAGDADNYSIFYSNESSTKPELTLNYDEVDQPTIPHAPEPSSMILGLISLGGLLHCRRKN